MDPARRLADLRITGRSAEQHAMRQLAWAFAGIAMAVLAVGGVLELGPVPTLVGSVLLGAGGLLVPEAALGREAREARSAWRHALGAYLDLVTLMEAAGAGPETALQRAAEAGDSPAFRQIRATLAAAERTRRSIWSALAELGANVAMPELSELAASLTLVEHEGARIRRSLQAKADAIRTEQLADAKAHAGATTEKLSFPVVLLLVGFLIFIAYPAAVRIGEIGGP
jgi:Flp pilus assembly protein TadB